MSHYAEEKYDIYSETFRRARKEHKCDACKQKILPGHYYCALFTLFDGNTEHIKRCGACQLTHEHLRQLCYAADNDMWPDERLNCGLKYESEWGDEPPDEIAALPLLGREEVGKLLNGRKGVNHEH